MANIFFVVAAFMSVAAATDGVGWHETKNLAKLYSSGNFISFEFMPKKSTFLDF